MEDNKITIRFELTDEFKNHYAAESTVEVFESFGETEIDAIGEQLNIFLRQCGYIRKNDCIFMEDITEEEYDALASYLNTMRDKEGAELNDNQTNVQ